MKILNALVAVVFLAAASPALAQGSASEKGGDDAGSMMADGGAHPKSHRGKKHKKSGKMDAGMMDGGSMMHGGHMMDGGSMDHGETTEVHPGMDGGM